MRSNLTVAYDDEKHKLKASTLSNGQKLLVHCRKEILRLGGDGLDPVLVHTNGSRGRETSCSVYTSARAYFCGYVIGDETNLGRSWRYL